VLAGGTLEIESVMGAGTTIAASLPARRRQADLTPQPAPDAAPKAV
jgi:hypothetical protein